MHADPPDEPTPSPPEQDDWALPSEDVPSQAPGGDASRGLPPTEPEASESERGPGEQMAAPMEAALPEPGRVPEAFSYPDLAARATDSSAQHRWADASEVSPVTQPVPAGRSEPYPAAAIESPHDAASFSSEPMPPGALAEGVLPEREDVAPPDGTAALGTAPANQADWLDIICPYLLSEDGTWRSTQPDAGHRCTAQDPPGTLPSAFQERFCLTDRHDRCEMYKLAQSARAAALEEGGIAAGQVERARFRPSVRSVPLALGPSGGGADGTGRTRSTIPRHWLVAAGLGGAVIILVLLLLMLGGNGGPGGAPAGSPASSGDAVTAATPTPTPTPPPTPTPQPGSTPAATSVPASSSRQVRYEVQADEALQKIAAAFGTTRRAILRANDGMADRTPFVSVGDIIVVPVSADMPEADVIAVPGFVEFVEEG